MKIYYANTESAKRIAEHQSGVLEPEIIEQPPEGYKYAEFGKFFYKRDDAFALKLRYESGTYKVFTPQEYKMAKFRNSTLMKYTKMIPCDSGMIIDLTVEVKRVSEITFDDVVELFNLPFSYNSSIRQTFIDYWNSLHAKPVKVGDHYECYPYDSKDFTLLHLGDSRWQQRSATHKANPNIWKGLPLRIYHNPYVAVSKYERREA